MSQSQDNGVFGQQTQETSGSEFSALLFLVTQVLNKVQTVTLVEIMAVTNTGGVSPVGYVNVRPLVNQMSGNRESTPHGVINNIPYFRLQGGANAIILDPEVGDIGMCAFCSRDISSVKASKAQANPGSFRTFDWADGLYVGGMLNGTPSQYVRFAAAGIEIKSPTAIVLDAPTTTVTGNLIVGGTGRFAGLLTWLAGVVGSGSAIVNDRNIGSDHTHPVTTAPGTTGVPNP